MVAVTAVEYPFIECRLLTVLSCDVETITSNSTDADAGTYEQRTPARSPARPLACLPASWRDEEQKSDVMDLVRAKISCSGRIQLLSTLLSVIVIVQRPSLSVRDASDIENELKHFFKLLALLNKILLCEALPSSFFER